MSSSPARSLARNVCTSAPLKPREYAIDGFMYAHSLVSAQTGFAFLTCRDRRSWNTSPCTGAKPAGMPPSQKSMSFARHLSSRVERQVFRVRLVRLAPLRRRRSRSDSFRGVRRRCRRPAGYHRVIETDIRFDLHHTALELFKNAEQRRVINESLIRNRAVIRRHSPREEVRRVVAALFKSRAAVQVWSYRPSCGPERERHMSEPFLYKLSRRREVGKPVSLPVCQACSCSRRS